MKETHHVLRQRPSWQVFDRAPTALDEVLRLAENGKIFPSWKGQPQSELMIEHACRITLCPELLPES